MQIPPLDHVGWGRLMAAVMESDPTSAGAPARAARPVDETDRIRRIERTERTVVLEGSTDVYA